MAMMGFQGAPARLFYDFCLEEHVLSITCSGALTTLTTMIFGNR
jgi:hypothetical protein